MAPLAHDQKSWTKGTARMSNLVRVKCIAVAMGAAAVMLIGSAASAQAKATGDTICTGFLYDVTITTNLTVPAGASCTMELCTVDGNVSVGAGADFYFAPFDHLEGNLSAEAADSVTLGVSEFDGNVSVDGTSGTTGGCGGAWTVCMFANTFNANVRVTNTNPGWFAWADNTVASNVGCSGNVFVANNGATNTVLGNESGQCSGL
jgi:hypothetical protein